jgi:hypothetical protein
LGSEINDGDREMVGVVLNRQRGLFCNAAATIGTFSFVIWDVVPSGGQIAKRRALCDQAVSSSTTTDMVELQRASFLVRYPDCSITKRLE